MPCGTPSSCVIQSHLVLLTIVFWLHLVIKELIISIASSEKYISFSYSFVVVYCFSECFSAIKIRVDC